jgi:tRNA A-37 threonylcarbamoyl transferase component Bud32
MDPEDNESVQSNVWRDYFLNVPGDCSIRGLVLEDIEARPLCDNDVSSLDVLRSGREGLEAIHKQGVLHGDVKNTLNAMVSSAPEIRIRWIDFSMARIGGASFAKDASREIRLWNRYFRGMKQRGQTIQE